MTCEILQLSSIQSLHPLLLRCVSPAVSDCLRPDHRPVSERGRAAVLAVTVISTLLTVSIRAGYTEHQVLGLFIVGSHLGPV